MPREAATPVIISGPLFARSSDVESLFHREGFFISHPCSLSTEGIEVLVRAMGHSWESLSKQSSEFLVLPLLYRRSLTTGNRVVFPKASQLLSICEVISDRILGASKAQNPHCLLCPSFDNCADASSILLSELMAPVSPPSLPLCHTLSSENRVCSTLMNTSLPAKGGALPVSLEEIFSFVFPPHELHPRSTGRLILYSQYGPLQGGLLRGGKFSSRALTAQELNVAIDTLEEEDVLAAFPGSFSFGMADAKDILTLVRLDGKFSMPQLSKEQVRDMLEALPRIPGPSNLQPTDYISFPDIQGVVLDARRARVSDLGRTFPLPSNAELSRTRFAPAPSALGRNTLLPLLQGSIVPLIPLNLSRKGPQDSKGIWRKESTIGHSRKVDSLLHTRLQQVSHIYGSSTSALIGPLIANTSLIRDTDHLLGKEEWLSQAPFRLSRNRGTYVPGTSDFSKKKPPPKYI